MFAFRIVGLGLALSGCVSAASLKSTVAAVTGAQAPIVAGVSALDALCQHAQTTPDGLAACRAARDNARTGLAAQLAALKEWTR